MASASAAGNPAPTEKGKDAEKPKPQIDISNYECPICLQLLLDPVVGNCGHDFCLACIEGWSVSRRHSGRSICCPVCRGLVMEPLKVCLRLRQTIEILFPDQIEARRQEQVEENKNNKRPAAGQPNSTEGPTAPNVEAPTRPRTRHWTVHRRQPGPPPSNNDPHVNPLAGAIDAMLLGIERAPQVNVRRRVVRVHRRGAGQTNTQGNTNSHSSPNFNFNSHSNSGASFNFNADSSPGSNFVFNSSSNSIPPVEVTTPSGLLAVSNGVVLQWNGHQQANSSPGRPSQVWPPDTDIGTDIAMDSPPRGGQTFTAYWSNGRGNRSQVFGSMQNSQPNPLTQPSSATWPQSAPPQNSSAQPNPGTHINAATQPHSTAQLNSAVTPNFTAQPLSTVQPRSATHPVSSTWPNIGSRPFVSAEPAANLLPQSSTATRSANGLDTQGSSSPASQAPFLSPWFTEHPNSVSNDSNQPVRGSTPQRTRQRSTPPRLVPNGQSSWSNAQQPAGQSGAGSTREGGTGAGSAGAGSTGAGSTGAGSTGAGSTGVGSMRSGDLGPGRTPRSGSGQNGHATGTTQQHEQNARADSPATPGLMQWPGPFVGVQFCMGRLRTGNETARSTGVRGAGAGSPDLGSIRAGGTGADSTEVAGAGHNPQPTQQQQFERSSSTGDASAAQWPGPLIDVQFCVGRVERTWPGTRSLRRRALT